MVRQEYRINRIFPRDYINLSDRWEEITLTVGSDGVIKSERHSIQSEDMRKGYHDAVTEFR